MLPKTANLEQRERYLRFAEDTQPGPAPHCASQHGCEGRIHAQHSPNTINEFSYWMRLRRYKICTRMRQLSFNFLN